MANRFHYHGTAGKTNQHPRPFTKTHPSDSSYSSRSDNPGRSGVHRGRSPARATALSGWAKPDHRGHKRKQVSPASSRYHSESGDPDEVSPFERVYGEGFRDGEHAREQKLAGALAQNVIMRDEIKELQMKLDLVIADATAACANAEGEKRLRLQAERALRELRDAAQPDQLRATALASRVAGQPDEEDILMAEGVNNPAVRLPKAQLPRNNGDHAAGPAAIVSPPVPSAGGGREAATPNSAPAQKKPFEQWRKDKYPDTFPAIPADLETLKGVIRKAEAEGGAASVWALRQWYRHAQKARDAGQALSQCEAYVLEWTVPQWYKAELDAMRGHRSYTLMMPPTSEHPFEHWHKHFQKNHETIRKGLRRNADGTPDLESLEGMYLANLMFHETSKARVVYRNRALEKLAAIFVDPHAYQATLDRFDLEPVEELSYQPYTGSYPASVEEVCRHAAICGITPWDVQHTFRVWAQTVIGTTHVAPAVADAPPVAQPTIVLATVVEDEAPAASAPGSADLSASSVITPAIDPASIPLPEDSDDGSHINDIDMAETSTSADGGAVSA